MLLPALSRLVGVISHSAVIGGTPSPSLWKEIGETVSIDKPPQLAGASRVRLGESLLSRFSRSSTTLMRDGKVPVASSKGRPNTDDLP